MSIKKILASAFALLICCGTLIAPQIKAISNILISAEDITYTGSCGENATYSFDETTGILTISGIGDMNFTNIENHSYGWQSYAESIKSIIIEDGITSISNGAFIGCKNLENLSLFNNIINICGSSFNNTCPFILNYPNDFVILGNGILYIYKGNEMESITIPDGVTTINNWAFKNCQATNIVIPNSVQYIKDYAFYNCIFENINIPDSVISIDKFAFDSCYYLKEITIPINVSSLGQGAFNDCDLLSNVTILSNKISIDDLKNSKMGYHYDKNFNYLKIEDFTIYGIKGSTAEEYALENEFNFVAIEEETPPTENKTTITYILNLKKFLLGIYSDITDLDFNQDTKVNILDLNVAKQSILY